GGRCRGGDQRAAPGGRLHRGRHHAGRASDSAAGGGGPAKPFAAGGRGRPRRGRDVARLHGGQGADPLQADRKVRRPDRLEQQGRVREKIVELAEEYFRSTAMTMTKTDKE